MFRLQFFFAFSVFLLPMISFPQKSEICSFFQTIPFRTLFSNSWRIHVWYMIYYIILPKKSTIHVGRYTRHMDCTGKSRVRIGVKLLRPLFEARPLREKIQTHPLALLAMWPASHFWEDSGWKNTIFGVAFWLSLDIQIPPVRVRHILGVLYLLSRWLDV